jgi:hypothetical protein
MTRRDYTMTGPIISSALIASRARARAIRDPELMRYVKSGGLCGSADQFVDCVEILQRVSRFCRLKGVHGRACTAMSSWFS